MFYSEIRVHVPRSACGRTPFVSRGLPLPYIDSEMAVY